jgi:hypothetical protein
VNIPTAQGGFALQEDARSPESSRSFLGAIGSPASVVRYAAYRLLNDAYGTSFDLETLFFAEKYALGPYDSSSEQEANAKRLAQYWQSRLTQR